MGGAARFWAARPPPRNPYASSTDTSNTNPARYLRSSVLGGQVVAEVNYVNNSSWQLMLGYVYIGSGLLVIQQRNGANLDVYFVHEDPVTKGKRVTNTSGVEQSAVELDPFGAEANSSNSAFQPRKFTTYERDPNGTDEAMMRRYNRWHARFDQPDPFDGSYDQSDPRSLNRYAYTRNDPISFADPTGLCMEVPLDMGESGVRMIPVGGHAKGAILGRFPGTLTAQTQSGLGI